LTWSLELSHLASFAQTNLAQNQTLRDVEKSMKNLTLMLCLSGIAFIAQPLSAQEPQADTEIPLSNTPSTSYEAEPPLTYAQQIARFESEQRIMRMQFNKWIGYEPLRPAMNSSYMSNGLKRYYLPTRGWIVTPGYANAWYW
jgi:hypothetical protein